MIVITNIHRVYVSWEEFDMEPKMKALVDSGEYRVVSRDTTGTLFENRSDYTVQGEFNNGKS